MTEYLKGGCLCGQVQYQVPNDFAQFFLCHCDQCRQITGSAHASNLFCKSPVEWLSGEEYLQTYDMPERNFRKVFCRECGSGMPYVSRRTGSWVVPAGSLKSEPHLEPTARIFMGEAAKWHGKVSDASAHEFFP